MSCCPRLCGLIGSLGMELLGLHHTSWFNGQEAVLPIEVNLAALRFAKQNDLLTENYYNLMMDNIDEVADNRSEALKGIEKEKLQVAKFYNKKVKLKQFQVGDWSGK